MVMVMRFSITSSGSKFPSWWWLTRIKESCANGKWAADILSRYREMKQAGIPSTEHSHSLFPPILKACLLLSFKHGISVHASLIKLGFQSFTSIENSIMDFYVKSGSLNSAMRVFDFMRNRDSVSWNIIIHGNIHQGVFGVGLWLFSNARVVGFEPNISTLVLVIQACRNFRATEDALKIHGYLVRSGFWNVSSSVQNALLGMYTDVSMKLARHLFDEMCDIDVISWTVMIAGYVQCEEAMIALELFLEMVHESGIGADGQTMVSILKACTNLGNMRMGESLHAFVISKGLDNDVFVGNSLVDLYSKCHDVGSAYRAFSEIPQRNVVSWNSLLCGYVYNEQHFEALMLFDSMGKEDVEADEVTLVNLLQICKHFVDLSQCMSLHTRIIRHGYESNELVINSLIDVYAKCNCIALSWKLFNKMQRRDAVTWTTMIAGFTHCGLPDEAIAVCQEMMRTHKELNTVTMLNLLEACSLCADLKTSKLSHGIAIRRGLASDVAVGTAIVDTYSKSGAVEISRKVFNQIHQKNIVSWSAMIAAYGVNGFPQNALALLSEMKAHGLKPNEVTALSVLSACSHGGLVEDGLSLFKEFLHDYELELGIEHYSCLVDMLARAGKLDNAMDLIKSLPNERKPGASAWGALLSACKNYHNFELGADALPQVLELEPSSSAGYLLGSNMYAASGSWVDAARMRRLVKDRGVKVVAGYSLVNVHNKTCKFVAGDRYHLSSSDALHSVIEQIHSCMKLKEGDFDAIFGNKKEC